MTVLIDGENLTIEQVHAVARGGESIALTDEAQGKVQRCRELVQRLVDSGVAIYGVTTGIGEFARIRVSQEQSEELQRRIIYSHAASTGDIQPPEVVRAAMLCRANTLAKGVSGVRLETLQTYMEILNRGIVPVVYEKGSVGTSGDLSPLSQLAMVALGEGEAFYEGERMPGGEAMRRAGLEPVVPTFKEGLGLINGAQMMTGESALILYDAERLVKTALIAMAMTLDVLKAVPKAYHPRVHESRPFAGQIAVARNLRKLFDGSEIMADPSGKVQDGYSMRCTPQVIGPTIDAYHYVRDQILTEINAASDNPLFFPDEKLYLAAGNFHAQSTAMAMDFLAIALSEVASLSERHTNRMLNPVLSGLPDFLIEGRGVNSGLMVAQYTQAALIAENKVLSHPAVVDSISVSADQEDHVNMGPVSVRKCKEVLKNVGTVVAIQLLAGAQALDFRKPKKPGAGVAAAYEVIRERVPFMEDDRALYPDIEQVGELVRGCELLDAVEAAVGPLSLTPDD